MASTTTHDEGFHEIQLNGKQLVFLFMAGTVVAVVIFLCGVLVGRGVRLTPTAIDPLSTDATVAPIPEAPSVALNTGPNPPASSAEELSYAGRLTTAGKSNDSLTKAQVAAPKSVPDATPAAAAPPAPPAPKTPAAATDVATEPAGTGFAIQVAALRERSEAEGIVRRLTTKGYSAYVMSPAAGAPSVFRVRVGKFKDRREAEAVSSRLQKEEQFKPWIVR